MTHGKSEYTIYIKYDDNKDTVETHYLHEFFHCIQYEEGFPSLLSYAEGDNLMAIEISSAILDIDVRNRLRDNGYSDDRKNISLSIQKTIKLLKMLQILKDKQELSSTSDLINTACLLSTANLYHINIKEVKFLLQKLRPKVIKYYNLLEKYLKQYPYDTPEGVKSIFENLLSDFGLYDTLYISEN